MDRLDPGLEVTYRRAAAADLPRLFEVFRSALNGYLVPAGQEPVPDRNDQQPIYEHLLRQDGERLWVAEAGDDVVAWSSGLVRGDWWFLGDLFVLPEAQGRGIGSRLFELAETGAPPGAVRATVTDSLQPISNTLYAHRGLLPREVLIGFGGAPREGLRLPRLGTLEPERLTLASLSELREIDAAASGLDRGVDHGFHLGGGGRYGWLFRRRGRAVAYAIVRPDGWVGPAAALRERDIETVVASGIAALARRGAEKVRGGVTGRCEGAQRAFWQAGMVFDGTPGILLASRPFGRLDRYLAASYGMF
jgi:GNAT superfamily N-acetyltransferase